MKRREFLSAMLASYGGLNWQQNFNDKEPDWNLPDNGEKPKNEGLSILQGFTDETIAQFTIDIPIKSVVHYSAVDRETGKKFEPFKVRESHNKKNQFRVDHVIFKDLYLGSKFYLVVTDKKNQVLDTRLFGMLDTNKSSAKIALLSCMYDLSNNHSQMWEIIKNVGADMYFLIGDVVYGDVGGVVHGPNFLWSRYIQTRQSLGLYYQKELTPTIAIWDDHDFGKNDADGSYRHKENSLETFKSFYGQEAVGVCHRTGPGVSSSFSAFGQKFIFLDDRFWRALPNSYSDVGYLGDSQLTWLQGELSHSQGQTWIIQGSQTFGYFKKKSGTYEVIAPNELKFVESLIRQTGKPTWFASGDVHFSEVSRLNRAGSLGFNSYEITSSCMHSLYLDRLPENDRRVPDAAATRENFVVIEVFDSVSVVNTKCYGIGNQIKFENQLEIT